LKCTSIEHDKFDDMYFYWTRQVRRHDDHIDDYADDDDNDDKHEEKQRNIYKSLVLTFG